MTKKKTYLFITFILSAWTAFLFKETITLNYLMGFTAAEKVEIQKLSEIINLTQNYYVDDVSWEKVSAKGIQSMLHSLDPHSNYFTVDEGLANDEGFDGKYQGIGIQYDVIDSYINVISVIPGSPSEHVGILSGDIITEIEGEAVCIYELLVGAGDYGKVIGKRGQNADAIRTILNAVSSKSGKRGVLEILE